MDLSDINLANPAFDAPAERRVSPRPPTCSRYKRLRREVNAPEELKEMLFKGMRPGVLMVLAAALALAVTLLH
jgi:hypothetical protein